MSLRCSGDTPMQGFASRVLPNEMQNEIRSPSSTAHLDTALGLLVLFSHAAHAKLMIRSCSLVGVVILFVLVWGRWQPKGLMVL